MFFKTVLDKWFLNTMEFLAYKRTLSKLIFILLTHNIRLIPSSVYTENVVRSGSEIWYSKNKTESSNSDVKNIP